MSSFLNFRKEPTAISQVLLVSFTCFCCPGLFNALSSVAAGIADPTISYNGTSILNGFFAVFGLVAGGLVNVLGPRTTLFIGGWGYVLYAASLLVMDHNKDDSGDVVTYSSGARAFFYIACAVLGMCAGLLWTAQGQMCMAYPSKENKGKYFSVFWVIFNLGATIGGIITFGTNYNSSSSGADTGTYVAFLILMSLGTCLSLLLSKPENIKRSDGTMVEVPPLPDWRVEAVAVLKLFLDPKMLLLFPLFAYSNWFYTYHTYYNVGLFNTRSGGFGSIFYWGAQMLGAYLIGQYLDSTGSSRRERAMRSLFILLVITSLMWGLGLWAQLHYDISGVSIGMDFKEGRYWVPFILYFYYGLNDAICQVWSYWLMGQMSDDISELGRYAGYYKAVQSAMAAVSWKIGAVDTDPIAQLLINWVLCVVGIGCAYLSIRMYVTDMDVKKDLENYGEMASPAKSITKSPKKVEE